MIDNILWTTSSNTPWIYEMLMLHHEDDAHKIFRPHIPPELFRYRPKKFKADLAVLAYKFLIHRVLDVFPFLCAGRIAEVVRSSILGNVLGHLLPRYLGILADPFSGTKKCRRMRVQYHLICNVLDTVYQKLYLSSLSVSGSLY